MVEFIHGDCIEVMKGMESGSCDVVITSPPYNLGIRYNTYHDERKDYLAWTRTWIEGVFEILSHSGSFFLNISGSPKNPWVAIDVASIARDYFVLQNSIVWVKSITIGDRTHGHFKPMNSTRFLNDTHETIFHFTKDGNVHLDKLAIGVPFTDTSNIGRFGHSNDRRCRGNTWFIPYKTINSRKAKGNHPAIFPEELVENCLKLHGKCQMVLDPFSGTGTTAVICKKLGIDCKCIEIDEQYINVGKNRIKEMSCESQSC